MALFSVSKKKKTDTTPFEEKKVLTSEKIIFEKLTSDEDIYLTNLADKLIEGLPLILNFEPLDIDQANKSIAFLSGVVYAVGGEIAHVKEKVFLFGNQDVLKDGSISEFLKEIVG